MVEMYRSRTLRTPIGIAVLVLLLTLFTSGSEPARKKTKAESSPASTAAVPLCVKCIHAHMEFLASDALRGRASGSPDELLAATYAGSELLQYGLQPAGDNGGFLQQATLIRRKASAPPVLRFKVPGQNEETVFTHGQQMFVWQFSQSYISGPLQQWENKPDAQPVRSGSVVLMNVSGRPDHRQMSKLRQSGVVLVLVPASSEIERSWATIGTRLPSLPSQVEGAPETGLSDQPDMIMLSKDFFTQLSSLPEGTTITLTAKLSEEKSHTWNAVGMLPGSDPKLASEAIVLSAHLDHVGVGKPVDGDSIYNGADDDASGVTAVLELARAIASGPKPKRTIIFALYGSEETGGYGTAHFIGHPTVALQNIVADIEFEMLGRPDPAVPAHSLWMTGFDLSNLGSKLAAHGAPIVADPHPEQNFFKRAENYIFARKGVVAHTICSYGLHKDYHRPSDDLAHIDFAHLEESIASMLKPVLWLANSDFKPTWNDGKKP